MMRPCTGVLILLATLLPILSACGERAEGVDRLLKDEVYGEAIPVETLVLAARPFAESFKASGVLEARDNVTVSAEIAGRLVAVKREIGDRVEEGDLLVSLDDRAIRAQVTKIEAQLARARTQLEWAKKDLDRQERLFADAVAAERALDEAHRLVDAATNDVAAQEAELEIARVDLSRCEIQSPIAGAVSKRHVAVGEYVTPGTQLFDLVATDELEFVFSVAERDVTGVRLGERLQLRIDAHREEPFTGTVRAISPAGSERTRTFRVELRVANQGGDRRLLPGMSGTAEVIRAHYDNVYLIPEPTILRDGTSSYIYVADGEQARRVDVRIASQVGALAVVPADFPADADCIILGQAAVSDGAPIRVRRRHETPPEDRFD